LVKAKSGSDITYETTNLFYHLGLNLYVIKTPEQIAAPHTSQMETFFGATVLATVLNGKTFDPHKEHDAPGKYGEFVFASRVIEPNVNTINFSGFAPLLDRIVAVLEHYAGLKKVPIAVPG
jgi:hypothetical protein